MFSCDFDCCMGNQLRYAGQVVMEQAIFRPHFATETSRGILNTAAWSLMRLPNFPAVPIKEEPSYDLIHLCAGVQLQLPVFLHLLFRCSPIATGLGGLMVLDGDVAMTCAEVRLK